MLYISEERAHSLYEGAHPITGKHVSCKWKDFTQADFAAIYNADPSNRYLFVSGSPEDFNTSAIKEQPNVNTTAPSTTATRITTTTAKTDKGAITE